jgi:hypothetical protein
MTPEVCPMSRFDLFIQPAATTTRLLLTQGNDKLLRAALPTPTLTPGAAPALCEALALWLDQPICVALCVDDLESPSVLGLCDELRLGKPTGYDVEAVFPRRRELGSLRDRRQLARRGAR